MYLETERLILRPMQAADIPALVALWSNPTVTAHMGGPRETTSLEQTFADDLCSPSPPTYDLWPVEERETKRVIGHCGLLDKTVDGVDEIELVYVFHVAVWGRGYATEIARALLAAAGRLRLRRVIALIDPDNAGSARVAEKVGLVYERDVLRPDDKFRRLYVVTLPT